MKPDKKKTVSKKTDDDKKVKNSTSNKDVIGELKKQLEEEKQKRLQVMADFENFKKRIEKERATFAAIANLSLIQEILEVVDDIGLALDDTNLTLERAKEILDIAKQKLTQSVVVAGVEKLEIKKGDNFDKEIMEAISVVPDKKLKNKVIAVISSAYKYKDKDGVIRPAKVIVGK
jgi:molecular chaperone GrpE